VYRFEFYKDQTKIPIGAYIIGTCFEDGHGGCWILIDKWFDIQEQKDIVLIGSTTGIHIAMDAITRWRWVSQNVFIEKERGEG